MIIWPLAFAVSGMEYLLDGRTRNEQNFYYEIIFKIRTNSAHPDRVLRFYNENKIRYNRLTLTKPTLMVSTMIRCGPIKSVMSTGTIGLTVYHRFLGLWRFWYSYRPFQKYLDTTWDMFIHYTHLYNYLYFFIIITIIHGIATGRRPIWPNVCAHAQREWWNSATTTNYQL